MNEILYVGKHAVTYSVNWHAHETWELIYCTSGHGTLIFRDRELHYRADTIAIIPPNTPHCNVDSDGFTNIHMNLSDCVLTFREPVVLPAEPREVLHGLFTASFYYYSRSEAERSMLLPLYGQLIISTLSLLQPEHLHSELVQRIENQILHNYPDPDFNLNAYLQTLPFSFAYLKRMFKQEVGLTPLQFLTEKRLENAAGNLSAFSEGVSISEIARMSGFNEPLYFSRLFKKKYGVSPRNYSPEKGSEPVSNADEMKIML